MATVTQPIPATESSIPTQSEAPVSLLDFRHRITIEEYHRMADAGVFGPEPRLELLEGVLIDKMTKNPPHIVATDLVEDLLHHLLPRGSGYCISMGNPVTIENRDGEPEPDAMVVRGNIRDYTGRRRTPADAVLVIEVANTSYVMDRQIKWIAYAGAGVPIYWIVDLGRGRLEIHSEPAGEADTAYYGRTQILRPDEEAALVLDGREIARLAVREILP
jgi:Uma2 family endonuclease